VVIQARAGERVMLETKINFQQVRDRVEAAERLQEAGQERDSKEKITELMTPLCPIAVIDGGIRVGTHCLFPSNATVYVSIRRHMGDSYIISDDRAAIEEASSAGLQFFGSKYSSLDRKLNSVVKHYGLTVRDGAIYSPQVPLEAIPAVVLLVANASKEGATWLFSNMKYSAPRNFKKDVADLLERYFNDNLKHNDTVIGSSNKEHHFSHIVYLSDQRRLLIDPVINDASSINARVIANLDVRLLNDSKILQRVIYDDSVSWKSSDLKLLEMGADPLPFSMASTVIGQLAA
jgi:hypothetical protein